jgi:outer membrane protein assembly factor BamB
MRSSESLIRVRDVLFHRFAPEAPLALPDPVLKTAKGNSISTRRQKSQEVVFAGILILGGTCIGCVGGRGERTSEESTRLDVFKAAGNECAGQVTVIEQAGHGCMAAAVVGSMLQVAEIDVSGNTLRKSSYPYPTDLRSSAASAFSFSHNGFVCVGALPSQTHDNVYDTHVYRYHGFDVLAWRQEIPSKGWPGPSDVIACFDGGVLVVGSTPALSREAPQNYFDVFAVKFDETGQKKWEGTWGGAKQERVVRAVEDLSDFVLIGYTLSESAGGSDTLIMMVDGGGELKWQRRYGGVDDEQGVDGIVVAEGNLLILTNVNVRGSYEKIELLNVDARGQLLWNKRLETPGPYSGQCLASMGENAILVGGHASSEGVIMKIAGDGKVEWERRLGTGGVLGVTSAALIGNNKVVVGVNVDSGAHVCGGVCILDVGY